MVASLWNVVTILGQRLIGCKLSHTRSFVYLEGLAIWRVTGACVYHTLQMTGQLVLLLLCLALIRCIVKLFSDLVNAPLTRTFLDRALCRA